jgi:hypothetical protein
MSYLAIQMDTQLARQNSMLHFKYHLFFSIKLQLVMWCVNNVYTTLNFFS